MLIKRKCKSLRKLMELAKPGSIVTELVWRCTKHAPLINRESNCTPSYAILYKSSTLAKFEKLCP